MTANTIIWGYREGSGYEKAPDLIGFAVEATDGKIGKVIHAGKHEATGGSYVIVDTGPWIFGKQVVLPAGAVALIDLAREVVFVDRTRQEIKNAPEFATLVQSPEPEYLDQLGHYYGAFYGHLGH
jgi:hypothetical protein